MTLDQKIAKLLRQKIAGAEELLKCIKTEAERAMVHRAKADLEQRLADMEAKARAS